MEIVSRDLFFHFEVLRNIVCRPNFSVATLTYAPFVAAPPARRATGQSNTHCLSCSGSIRRSSTIMHGIESNLDNPLPDHPTAARTRWGNSFPFPPSHGIFSFKLSVVVFFFPARGGTVFSSVLMLRMVYIAVPLLPTAARQCLDSARNASRKRSATIRRARRLTTRPGRAYSHGSVGRRPSQRSQR